MTGFICFLVGLAVGAGGVWYLTHKKLAQDIASKVTADASAVKADVKKL
jgi:hypothetical protein